MSGAEGTACVYGQSLGDSDLSRLSRLIEERTGIRTPPAKRSLVEGRLYRRLKALGLPSFKDYCDLLFSPRGEREELGNFINAITTNKTEFFREEKHFRFLEEKVLPELAQREGKREIKVWSVGCSTGEEAYSLAMCLEEMRARAGGPEYSILCTDISTDVLDRARRGVYGREQVKRVPPLLLTRYFRAGTGEKTGLYRVDPLIRSRMRFRYLNLMEEPYPVERADLIFFKNVLIYFYPQVQRRLTGLVAERLAPGGYLFIGLSENMQYALPGISKVAPSIFRREAGL
jgi:chemotaxis protein methyltransferase CheR